MKSSAAVFRKVHEPLTIETVDLDTWIGAVAGGLNLVPEGRRIFRNMTVEENVRLGAYTRRRSNRGPGSAPMPW